MGALPSLPRSLREGDVDPVLAKKVRVLILTATCLAVYLDDDLFVEWYTTEDYGAFAREFGAVMNRVGYLEAMGKEQLDPERRFSYQRLVGESVARLLEDRRAEAATEMLDRAESIIKAPPRLQFTLGALGTAALNIVALAAEWVFRESWRGAVGATAADLLVAAHLGALGALLSVMERIRTIDVDPGGSRLRQRFEGALRPLVGFAGGLVAALAIKTNLVFGFAQSVPRALPLLALVGIVAGASERVVPTIVHRVEEAFVARPERRRERKPRGADRDP